MKALTLGITPRTFAEDEALRTAEQPTGRQGDHARDSREKSIVLDLRRHTSMTGPRFDSRIADLLAARDARYTALVEDVLAAADRWEADADLCDPMHLIGLIRDLRALVADCDAALDEHDERAACECGHGRDEHSAVSHFCTARERYDETPRTVRCGCLRYARTAPADGEARA